MGYSDAVLEDGPVGYWPMQDTSGTTMVAAVGTSGTYHASPTLGAGGPLVGHPDTAVSFAAASSQYATAALDLSAASRITVEVWHNYASYANTDALLCEHSANANTNIGWYMNPNQSAAQYAAAGQGTTGSGVNNDTAARPATGWVHVCATCDITIAEPQWRFYFNGVAQSMAHTGIAQTGTFATTTLYVACRGGTTLFSTVTMCHLAVYSKLVSATRIKAHYVEGSQRGGVSLA